MDLGPTIPFPQALILWFISVWILTWKGIALWRSAQAHQRNWFIIMLVLSGYTIGILEIIYLFFFAKKRLTIQGIKSWFQRLLSPKHR